MLKTLPKPQQRSPLRMALGKIWFSAKRRVQWYVPGKRYAATRSAAKLPHQHASHRTPLLRQLKGVDMWLQHNKVDSLKVAASCIDGLLLRPGETFSFWRLVGKPSARRGFKAGMVLRNGIVAQGMGGGLCQMTNLIYWMALHTELSITERWRHGLTFSPMRGAASLLPRAPLAPIIISTCRSATELHTPINCGCGWKAITCMASGGPTWLPATLTKLSNAIMPSGLNGGAAIAVITRFIVWYAIWILARNAGRNSSPRTMPS